MSVRKSPLIVIFVLSLATVSFAQAQDVAADPAASPAATAPVYSQAQIDQMLAPIALYPDPLLGQVLMASTYPLEVVEASRWLQNSANAALTGDQLTTALDQQSWDPSVKALVAVPQVLTMMDKNLQWTEQLGDAFLAQQAAVTDSIQQLRQQAQAAGSLNSTPQQTVVTQGSDIAIEPTNPDVVYIPVYNPGVVYGAWGYPDYPPYYFYPPNYAWGAGIIGFGVGIVVADSIWGWDRWDWRNHRITIDNRRFSALNHGRPPLSSGVWRHNPAHRQGVPYRDAATRARFQGGVSAQAQRGYRGYGAAAVPANARVGGYPQQVNRSAFQQQRQAAPEARAEIRNAAPAQRYAAPAPIQRPATPMFESFSRGADVRAQSARGAASRASPAPANNFHGGGAPAHAGGGGGRGNEGQHR